MKAQLRDTVTTITPTWTPHVGRVMKFIEWRIIEFSAVHSAQVGPTARRRSRKRTSKRLRHWIKTVTHSSEAAKLFNELVKKTETGMDFAGVLPVHAKRLGASDQAAPIKAEGLDSLGM